MMNEKVLSVKEVHHHNTQYTMMKYTMNNNKIKITNNKSHN